MIYVIMGTSGSGKSTIVRKIMEEATYKNACFAQGRKQPISYDLGVTGSWALSILGHYESDCGGVDTLHNMDEIFDLAKKEHNIGKDVLMEGVLLYSVPKRLVELSQAHSLSVVALTKVSLDECEESIRTRRVNKAGRSGSEPRPFGPNLRKNLAAKHRGTITAVHKLRQAGIFVLETNREEALEYLKRKIGHG